MLLLIASSIVGMVGEGKPRRSSSQSASGRSSSSARPVFSGVAAPRRQAPAKPAQAKRDEADAARLQEHAPSTFRSVRDNWGPNNREPAPEYRPLVETPELPEAWGNAKTARQNSLRAREPHGIKQPSVLRWSAPPGPSGSPANGTPATQVANKPGIGLGHGTITTAPVFSAPLSDLVILDGQSELLIGPGPVTASDFSVAPGVSSRIPRAITDTREESIQGQGEYRYRGNVESGIFHRASCRYFNCRNCTARFADRAAALSAGYRPCKVCRP